MKKKQPDFGKNTLKVGRPVGRRRNEPNVKVKSTRLEVKQKIKTNSDKTVQDLLKQIDSGTVTVRRASLPPLKKLIEKSPELLFPHVSKAVECLLKCIQVSEENVRINAMQVIVIVLDVTDDLHIRNFIPDIFAALGVLMTNIVAKVRGYSLAIVRTLLTKHPDLVCHSMTLLKELLQTLKTPFFRRHLPSTVEVPDIPYRYPISVLYLMNISFAEMFKPKESDLGFDRDEQEVYFNDQGEMLHLELYCGSGLHPVDIEKLLSPSSDQDKYFGTPSEIKKFIDDILDILPKIYIEEIGIDSRSDDKILSREAIGGLNVIFQLYCHVVEWADLISYPVDTKIVPFLQKVHFKNFPFEVAGRSGGMWQVRDCVELNLSTCYLLARFLLPTEPNDETYNEDIFNYMKRVLARSERVSPCEIKYISIPILIKIIKFYLCWLKNRENGDLLHILTQLSSLLRQVDDRPNYKLLISFLIDLSLSSDNSIEAQDTLKEWFNWLLKEGLYQSKYFLKVIQRIAARRYGALPLNSNFIKGLLNYEDEEVRNTALVLIFHMPEIPTELLEDISRHILLDPSFPKKSALRFIRVLKSKYTDKPRVQLTTKTSIYHKEGFLNYTLFLLNIAFDSHNLSNMEFLDCDTNEFTKAMKALKDKNGNPFTIVPSLHWKEHAVIFEECKKNLQCLPQYHVAEIAMEVVKEILNNTTVLPIHTALAILKLYNPSKMQAKYFRLLMCDLTFSCMLATSVLTTVIPAVDEWYKWNIDAIMVTLELDRILVQTIVRIINEDRYGKPESIVVYHILRVLNFFVGRGLLMPEDAETVVSTLEILSVVCAEEGIKQQPLYQRLFNYFHYYM